MSSSLRASTSLMDDFDAGMRMLLKLAEADGVAVRFMPLFEAFDVVESGR